MFKKIIISTIYGVFLLSAILGFFVYDRVDFVNKRDGWFTTFVFPASQINNSKKCGESISFEYAYVDDKAIVRCGNGLLDYDNPLIAFYPFYNEMIIDKSVIINGFKDLNHTSIEDNK